MTWEESFRCDLCGMYFRSRRIMERHNQQQHPDHGWVVIPYPTDEEIEAMRNDLVGLERDLR